MHTFRFISFFSACLLLCACGRGAEQTYPELVGRDQYSTDPQEISRSKGDSIFAEDSAIVSFVRSMTGKEGDSETATADDLFKASVETLSFMPLLSADAKSGVVLTDWYALPEDTTVRYKVNVLINKDKSLNVSAFKQALDKGQWKDTTVSPEFSEAVRQKILAKASSYDKDKKKK